MPALIDTSLWIDFTRAKSPKALKQFIAPYIFDPDACLTEPVVFELLRHATRAESSALRQQCQTLPLLPTPPDLWEQATDLGQACRKKGIAVLSIDLLIAAIAIHHDAEVITLDSDFERIASAISLRVKLLVRPRP
jgi:predicted nucleic acid-binding protein